jgi:hypothetical protein
VGASAAAQVIDGATSVAAITTAPTLRFMGSNSINVVRGKVAPAFAKSTVFLHEADENGAGG